MSQGSLDRERERERERRGGEVEGGREKVGCWCSSVQWVQFRSIGGEGRDGGMMFVQGPDGFGEQTVMLSGGV